MKKMLITLSVLLLSSFVLCIYLITTKNTNNEELNIQKYRVNNLLENFLTQIKAEYDTIPSNLDIKDEIGDSCTLYEFASDSNLLVFYFTSNHCGLCIENELRKINNHKYPGEFKLLLLTNTESERYWRILRNNLSLTIPVYFINENSLPLCILNYSRPFYFTLERGTNKGDNFLLIEPGLYDYSDKYFEIIKMENIND